MSLSILHTSQDTKACINSITMDQNRRTLSFEILPTLEESDDINYETSSIYSMEISLENMGAVFDIETPQDEIPGRTTALDSHRTSDTDSAFDSDEEWSKIDEEHPEASGICPVESSSAGFNTSTGDQTTDLNNNSLSIDSMSPSPKTSNVITAGHQVCSEDPKLVVQNSKNQLLSRNDINSMSNDQTREPGTIRETSRSAGDGMSNSSVTTSFEIFSRQIGGHQDTIHGDIISDSTSDACEICELGRHSFVPYFIADYGAEFSGKVCGAQQRNNDTKSFSTNCQSEEKNENLSTRALPVAPLGNGVLRWIIRNKYLQKLIKSAKDSMNFLISVLDPGMIDLLDEQKAPSVYCITSSSNNEDWWAISRAFEMVHPKLGDVRQIEGIALPNLPVLSVGFRSGLVCAERKIEFVRKNYHCFSQEVLIAMAPIVVEITPMRWHSCSCVLLEDPQRKLELHVYTQTTPVPNDYIHQIQEMTRIQSLDSSLGFDYSIAEAINMVSGIETEDWHSLLSGVSHYDMVEKAALSLAGTYRNYVESESAEPNSFESGG